ncbi:MAG: molybdopterin-dependent oxidoreductase [Vicinamibacterales bacterium]|nr:molybdopterin-dependent oxidoreductase [Vicinamibacterales bacterium]
MPVRPGIAPTSSTVEAACPLDCPDACTLSVTVRGGRVTEIDGARGNEITNGYICAKVRKFHQRVYGDDRLLYPAVRRGAKGAGKFERTSWDEALSLIAAKLNESRARTGGASILPLSYGGSNGLLTQDTTDAALFRRLGASRLARTVCAAPTGAANQAAYGKMASVTYQDYPDARLIVLWGVNPGVSGIHLMPYLKEARAKGATLVVIDPRTTPLARQADLHLAPRPGTDVALALAVHRHLFESGGADLAFLAEHTTGWERLRERASAWTPARAAEVTGLDAGVITRFAELYAESRPALINCGWGLERNRNGGNAALAVLTLPAVGGKFGVRGGGYAMSNTASWGIEKTWMRDQEPASRLVNMNQTGRALTEPDGVPIDVLFVYNCNPAVTLPDQARVIKGLEREDLFTVVFEQVMTDTALYADVVLPATTFLEGYDLVRGYGPITLQLGRPVIDQVGEARPNADVFAELTRLTGLAHDEDPQGELDAMIGILGELPAQMAEDLRAGQMPAPPNGSRPVQFVDVFPRTPDRKAHLCDEALDREAPLGLYAFQPDPATEAHPLALISPASDRTINSTLGELPRPAVRLEIHPEDAASRGVHDGDTVRVFNALGEMVCPAHVTDHVRPGTVSYPKGVWRRAVTRGWTSNALVPDTLTDLGGGACFNDARVQVARVSR